MPPSDERLAWAYSHPPKASPPDLLDARPAEYERNHSDYERSPFHLLLSVDVLSEAGKPPAHVVEPAQIAGGTVVFPFHQNGPFNANNPSQKSENSKVSHRKSNP